MYALQPLETGSAADGRVQLRTADSEMVEGDVFISANSIYSATHAARQPQLHACVLGLYCSKLCHSLRGARCGAARNSQRCTRRLQHNAIPGLGQVANGNV